MRRDRQRLNDVLEALDWIAKAIDGRSEADFLTDEALCYAIAQKLTIIGEAASRLSREITARHNSVPWADIVGLRNVLVHEYFGIYWPLVWQTVTDHALVLRSQIAEIFDFRISRVKESQQVRRFGYLWPSNSARTATPVAASRMKLSGMLPAS
jgi:uncharacterized protein with HEPN domain